MESKLQTCSAFSATSSNNGKTYYLHSKEVLLAGERPQRIYYFAKEIDENVLSALPEGYEVFENKLNGFPMVRRIKVDKSNSVD